MAQLRHKNDYRRFRVLHYLCTFNLHTIMRQTVDGIAGYNVPLNTL